MPEDPENVGAWRRFLDEFAEWMRVTNFSERTVYLYASYSAPRFCAWLVQKRGIDGPARITPEICMTFQRVLHAQKTREGAPVPATTQVGILTGVRAFTRFLKKRGYALVDPGLAIQMPRLPKRLPRSIMSEGEVTKLLSLPDVRTIRGYRARTIFEVLYATGIRCRELLSLDLADVDLESGRLRIEQGKGRKDRVVPLGAVATEYLAGYITKIRPKFLRGRETAAVFIGVAGDRLAEQSFGRELKRYIKAADFEKRVTSHTFRHTCATHMMRRGAGLRHIQTLLGHESIATTEIYTKVEIGDLEKAHEKFHPREKL